VKREAYSYQYDSFGNDGGSIRPWLGVGAHKKSNSSQIDRPMTTPWPHEWIKQLQAISLRVIQAQPRHYKFN
jgi:hypothetical protein